MKNISEIVHSLMNASSSDAKDKLRELLAKSGLSIEEIARRLQIDRADIAALLNGGMVTLENFLKIMVASGFTIEVKPLASLSSLLTSRNNGEQNYRKEARPSHLREMRSPSRPSDREFEELLRAGIAPSRQEIAEMSRSLGRPLTMDEINNIINQRKAQAQGVNAQRVEEPLRDETYNENNLLEGEDFLQTSNACLEQDQSVGSMNRRQMLETIISNGWENEINIYESSDAALSEFITLKSRSPRREREVQSPRTAQRPNYQLSSSNPYVEELAQSLFEMLKNKR